MLSKVILPMEHNKISLILTAQREWITLELKILSALRTQAKVLDCYSSVRQGRCKTSYSISGSRVTNSVHPDEVVNANCDITRDNVN